MKNTETRKEKLKTILRIEAYSLILIISLTFFALCREYHINPGLLDVNALTVKNKDTDSIELAWKPVRNADEYVVSYRKSGSENWETVSLAGEETEYTLDDLDEGTEYEFTLQANSEERKGRHESKTSTSTKKHQKIKGKKKQMKLAGKTDLSLDSKTDLTFRSEDEDVAKVNEDQTIELSPGSVTVTAEAEESDEYVGDEKDVELEVIDSVSEDPGDSEVHIISGLNKDNCEKIMTIKEGVPQSFVYKDGKYTVTFGGKTVWSYESGKNKLPAPDLGHANGLAYKDGTYYSVRGWSSKCASFGENARGCFSLPCNASGIAYDEKAELFYISTKTGITCVDKDLETVVSSFATVGHKGKHFAQDCGGHSGIVMHCISGSNKHGINYIDMYDAIHSKYLGTFECDLSEVESVTVDEDGYMLVLCNESGNKDYIYTTDINISDLGADMLKDLAEAEETEEDQMQS